MDPRTQYFAGDPRNADPKRVTLRLGDAATTDVMGMLNASYTTNGGIELYAFGGASNRDGESAANWRLPNGNNTIRAIVAGRLSALDRDEHLGRVGRGRREGHRRWLANGI